MEISNFLGKIKKEPPTVAKFLAIVINDEAVQAAVWHVESGRTEITTLGTPSEWSGKSEDVKGIVAAADATISSALEGVEGEPTRIVFGLVPSWTNKDGIAPDKLEKIKSICRQLELKPLGFVVIGDSIIRYLKMQEGTPTTSIMIQVQGSEIIVNLVRLGRVEAQHSVSRGDDIASDVESAISTFPDQVLPSRIMVYNSMHNLDEIVQNLTSYDWQGKFQFLHIPRVESLPKDVAIRAVALAGGSEVAKSIGFDIEEKPPVTEVAEQIEEVEEVQEHEETVDEVAAADDFVSPSELGFGEPQSAPPQTISLDDTPKSRLPAISLPKLKLPTLPRLSLKWPEFGNNNLTKTITLTTLGLVLLGVAYFSFAWFIPKATVIISVEQNNLDANLTLALSTTASAVDPENNIIPAQKVEKTVSGESSLSTTGTKTIGDKAAGEVTIYNRTSLPRAFKAGTTLTAGSLEFELESDVTVASKSAGADYVDVPGKATVKITAVQIGDAGNLAKNTEFEIDGYSQDTYVAKNDLALSGGTSQEVRVVSQDDLTGLVDGIKKDLVEKAQSELLSSSGSGVGIYVIGDSAKIQKENYSHKLGEQTDTVSGTIELSLEAITYRTEDVESLVAGQVASTIPVGYERTINLPQVEIGDIEATDDSLLEAKTKVVVELIPKVDTAVVQKTLRGKATSELENSLSGIVGFSSVTVKISPKWLPPRFSRLPRNPQNITVLVQAAN